MSDMQIVPAFKNVEAQYVELKVPLYSFGCERKVKKALAHLKGIYSVDVDFNQQKVTVWGICNKHDVLKTIRSKRKGTCFWDQEDTTQVVDQKHKPESPIVSSIPKRNFKFNRSLTLAKARSLSLKASLSLEQWKKLVFTRSNSFS